MRAVSAVLSKRCAQSAVLRASRRKLKRAAISPQLQTGTAAELEALVPELLE